MHVGRYAYVDVTPGLGRFYQKGFLFVTFVIFCENDFSLVIR